MGAFSATYSFTDGTTAYGSQVAYEIAALGNSVNNIVNAQIAAGAAIADSKLAQITTAGKVSGAAITLLTSVPSGAGELPAANLNIASAAEMKTGTDTEALATAANVVSHEGVVKVWAAITYSGGTPTLQESYNVDSITDTDTGEVTVTITDDFGSANYAVVAIADRDNSDAVYPCGVYGQAAGSFKVTVVDYSNNNQDPVRVNAIAIGDRA